jgi:hypothetical protein
MITMPLGLSYLFLRCMGLIVRCDNVIGLFSSRVLLFLGFTTALCSESDGGGGGGGGQPQMY